MACAAALNLVSASSSSSLRVSICCMAASWLRCSTRIVRCCLGMTMSLVAARALARDRRGSSVLRLDDEDALPAQRLADVKGTGRRLPVHVDVVAVDRAAGVLCHEPAPEAVVAIRRDVHPAAQGD